MEIIWDKKQSYIYQQTEKAKFDIINERYAEFLTLVDNVNSEPTRVFDSLKARQKEDLELIREVSKELQKKKIEDINKQKAVESSETESAEKAEETIEEQKETAAEDVQN